MQPEDEVNDRRAIDKARFRIDTTVNIAHILTTIAMVMAIFITAAVQAAGDRYWARFDAVQAATTVAQVNAVGW